MLREGHLASYVGPESDLIGHRCLVLSDEGAYAHVRWTTGSLEGTYGTAPTQHLASDRPTKVSLFDPEMSSDEFGMEPSAPRAVRIASAAIHDSGGEVALLRALASEGMLDTAREAARELVASLTLDPGWREVVSELGDRGEAFLGYTVRELISTAMTEEGRDGQAVG